MASQSPSVINGSPCLVAQQVGVDIPHVKRTGSFQDETPADLMLAEGKVAGTGIQDDIHVAPGEFDPPPIAAMIVSGRRPSASCICALASLPMIDWKSRTIAG